MSVAENLAALRDRIARAGGDPGAVTVVAVTKQQRDDAVVEALAAGLFDIGENRADALAEKAQRADDPRVRWHFLGQIQRNKIGKVARYVALWQSVDRPQLGPAIARHAPGAAVLVEVNLTDDPNRGGTSLAAVPALVRDLQADGLVVRGLMAVGPHGGPDAARPGFTAVVHCADELGLPVRSLGMSDDIDVAVACGSTMVRVGTALFGARPMPRINRRDDVD
ncbi:MAG TPA: YggS family pyridoxal phosphate enzyme [Acidimicrobiales bacterium]|nr:YggS family pyridoxal phosphate enzyme [Acidimicrobiales bacterium]